MASSAAESLAPVLIPRPALACPLSGPSLHDLGLVRVSAGGEAAAARLVQAPGPRREHSGHLLALAGDESDVPPVHASAASPHGCSSYSLGAGSWPGGTSL